MKRLQEWFEAHNIKPVFIKLKGYSGGNTDYQRAKHPIDKDWTHAQGLTRDEIDAWLSKGGWIGLIVPEGYIIVDIDDIDTFQQLQGRLQAHNIKHHAIKTPNGGQLFFKDTGRVKTQQAKTITAGGIVVDYRLAGKGQIVCPNDNIKGRFILHMDDTLDYMPSFFIPVMKYDPKKHEDKLLPVPILEHISGRDDTLFRHVCRLREWDARYLLKLSEDGLSEVIHQVNNLLCEPCLDERIVDEKIKQALAYPTSSKPKEEKVKQPTQAELLIQIGTEFTLFHDDTNENYAELDGENVKIRSSTFKQRLAREIWLKYGKAVNSDSMNQALNVLEAQAYFDGKKRILHNRVAMHEDAIYYDIGDGRCVRIIPGTWDIVSDPPMIFKRHTHQRPQVEPKAGGNLKNLFNYINVTGEEHQLLMQVHLVSCFIPDIAHPILSSFGDQGSGKSTTNKIEKSLIDPSKLDVFLAPRDMSEVVQMLEHHWYCPFDNLSDISSHLSDLFSQVCTGGGISRRKLFTDDEDIIYFLKRCIALNGITQLVQRPDLLDRSLLIQHARIETTDRKTEREILSRFEHEKPYLLGAIFDALAETLSIYPTVSLSELPRMADFALYGCAISEALGHTQKDFLDAYYANIKKQHSEAVSGSTLAQAVLQLMADKEIYEGTVADTFKLLSDTARVHVKDRTFPKAPNKIRKYLSNIRTNLLEYGITFAIAEGSTRTGTPITFQKMAKVSSQPSQGTHYNNINDLQREDSVKIKEDTKVSSQVSTPKNANNIKHCEDGEHSEDKNGTLWKGTDTEVIEVPQGVVAW